MPYNVILREEQDHIRVEVSGDRNRGKEVDDAISVWSQVAQICHEKNVYRILAISKLTGRLPILAAFEIAKSPEEFGWSRSFKLAFVDLNEESRQVNLFAETVAVNRGYWIKVFDNELDAKVWMLES